MKDYEKLLQQTDVSLTVRRSSSIVNIYPSIFDFAASNRKDVDGSRVVVDGDKQFRMCCSNKAVGKASMKVKC